MGWNDGYYVMESQVIALYNAGLLTPTILDALMEPFKDTDIDHGGSQDLKAKDGLTADEVICKIMEPEKWAAVKGDEDKAYDLFKSIWGGRWKCW